jgi:dihydrofolate synthase/folylpolyglutamate synthase
VSQSPHLTATAETLLAPRIEQRILPGLDRMLRALDAMGHPERGFASVIVVGTNGKGSTAALLAGVLQAHGICTGLYTSPHLLTVEERIRVDGTSISPQRLTELVGELGRFPDLSYFETLTCAAISQFAEQAVQVAVLEAGLGGRWDAVNAVAPIVSLLTNVGTDHQAWLGSTRAAIAAEKAAALRGREGVIGEWDAEIEAVVRGNADPATPLTVASQWAEVTGRRAQGAAHSDGRRTTGVGQCVAFRIGREAGEATLPLVGEHQLANLRLALAGAAALTRHGAIDRIAEDAVRRGIEGVTFPGRLQWIDAGGHALLLDGAHNLEAAAALTASLDRVGLAGKLHLLFSCLSDKPIVEMAAVLRPRVTGVTVAPITSPRATPVDELAAHFPGCRVATDVEAALALLPTDRPTLVTGSLRLVGEVLAALGLRHG